MRTSLAHDVIRFAVVNRDFRLLMRATEKNPNVLQCCSRKKYVAHLTFFSAYYTSCVVEKICLRGFPTWSDWFVQGKKMAKSLKFQI